MGIKLFNYLLLNLKQLYRDVKQFKLKLKEFLSHHSFYIWMSILNILVERLVVYRLFLCALTHYIILLHFIYLFASVLEL
jgi:hypothetical protein